jgi:hypothetical protein
MVSSAEAMGAFETGFVTINLHRPTVAHRHSGEDPRTSFAVKPDSCSKPALTAASGLPAHRGSVTPTADNTWQKCRAGVTRHVIRFQLNQETQETRVGSALVDVEGDREKGMLPRV